ncbi:hypothetical protein N7495_004784 [Penicillium taxi]|uniref:uncharacterized protein n=1 Tax=Penicillium taxi TaxID=168475 RepID=UPI0025453D87|nr:uncharacterized protein N7495_004784 [Penicillium taxi]KAJ5900040.1 hypothetical protein N7495_004784 [Penicillium taxi]
MEPEILVHISAPGTARDDARYRDHVNAILAYGPTTHESQSTQLSVSCAAARSPESGSHLGPSLLVQSTLQTDLRPVTEKSIGSNVAYDSLGSLISVIPDSQEVDEDRSSKRPRLESPIPANDPPTEERNTAITSIIPRQDDSTLASTSISLTLPLEIHPPPPSISVSHFTTHITPTLAMLTTRLKPERVYKPLNQSRVLEKLERGYWSLNIAIIPITTKSTDTDPKMLSKSDMGRQIWTIQLFHRFWTFLSDFVGRDARAGWGVWCVVDEDHTAATGSNRNNVAISGGSLVRLKVYAWGEIAMHIYLLLFLASERQIRGMGAQWMDYRDEMVIQMP